MLRFSSVVLFLCGLISMSVASKVVDLSNSEETEQGPPESTEAVEERSAGRLFLQAAQGMVVVGLFTMIVAAVGLLAAFKKKKGLFKGYVAVQTGMGLLILMFSTLAFASKVGLRACLTRSYSEEYIDSIQSHISVLGVFGMVSLCFVFTALFASAVLRKGLAKPQLSEAAASTSGLPPQEIETNPEEKKEQEEEPVGYAKEEASDGAAKKDEEEQV